MQPDKITNKNSELEILTSDSEKLISSLTDVMQKFQIKKHAVLFDFLKSKGLAISSLLSILIILPFYGVANICQLMKCGITMLDIKAKKDAYYGVKNNEFMNWRKLLMLHVRRFIYLTKNNINLKSVQLTALIFDDTLIEKTGKKIERVSLVNDHVSGMFVFGYKLLVCGFWDGESFIPIDFTLHREKGSKHMKLLKEYQKSLQILDKQKKIIQILKVKYTQSKQKLSEKAEKYQSKACKTNKLSYEKLKEKLNALEIQLSENKKVILNAQQAKDVAYKNLKRYYSKECLFGLSAKERKEQFQKAVSTKSHGFKRRKEADKDKISSMLEMLCRVVKLGIIPKYVLVDSWFFCFELVEKLSVLKKER